MQSVEGDVRLSVSLDTKGIQGSLTDLKQRIGDVFKSTDASKISDGFDEIIKSAKKAAEEVSNIKVKASPKSSSKQPKSVKDVTDITPSYSTKSYDELEKRLKIIRERFTEIADKQQALAESGQMDSKEFWELEKEANALGAEIDKIEAAMKSIADQSKIVELPSAENGEALKTAVKEASEELTAAKENAQDLNTAADAAANNVSSKMMKLQADVQKAAEKLALAKAKMQDFNNQAPKPTAEYSGVEKEISSISAKMEKLNNEKAKFVTDYGEFAQYMSRYKQLDSQIAELEAQYDRLNQKKAEMEASGTAFQPADTTKYQQLSNALQDAQRQYVIAKARLNEYNQAQAQGGSSTGRANINISRTGDEAKRTANELGSMGNAAKKSGNTLRSTFSGLQSVAKRAFSSIKSHFGKTAKEGGTAISSINNHLKGGFKTALKYVLGIQSLFTVFRKLKDEATEGYKNLAVYSDSVNKSISSVMAVLLQFKNQAAAAFQPLVSVAAPILTQFTALINKALFSLSQFFAALTGQDYVYKAVKVQQNYADSLKSTAEESEAAKKALNEYLSPLDEINKFTDKKADSTQLPSVGTDASNPQNMFETVKVESKFKELADKIKAKVSDIYGYVKNRNWKGLGSYIADDFNSGLQKIKDFISWDNLGDGISKATTAITDTVNSFVDNANWKLLGSTIGEGINTFVNTVDHLVSNTKWNKIGEFFAETFNGLTDTVDWKKLGSTIGKKFSVLPKTVLGFVKKLKWSDVGAAIGSGIQSAIAEFDLDAVVESIGTAFSGLLTSTRAMLEKIDMTALAKKLKSGIKKLFESIDFKEIGKTISEILIKALDFAIEATDPFEIIGGKIGDKIGNSLGDAISNINWGEIIVKALQLIGNLIINTIYVMSPLFAEDVARGLGESIADAIYRAKIADRVTVGVSEQLQEGLNNASKISDSLVDTINNSLSRIGDITTDMKVIDSYQERFNELIDKVNLSPEEEAELNTIVDYFSKNIDGFSEIIQGYIDVDYNGKVQITGHMSEIKEKIDEVIDSYQRLSMAAALSEMSQDTYKEYIKASEEYAKQKNEFKELLDLYSEERANGWQIWSQWNKISDKNSEEYKEKQKEAQAFAEKLKSVGIEINGNIENAKDFSIAMDGFETTIQSVNFKLDDAKTKLDEAKTSATDYSNATAFLKGQYDNLSGALEVYTLGLLSEQEIETLTGTSVDNLKGKVEALGTQSVETGDNISSKSQATSNSVKSDNEEMQRSFEDTSNAASSLEGSVNKAMTGISDTVRDKVNAAIDKIKELIQNIKNSNGSLGGIGAAAGSLIGNAVSTISISSGSGGSGRSYSSSLVHSKMPMNANYYALLNRAYSGDIPMLAKGAVIPANKEFLAILGDQKQGKNLEAPESLIRQIIREELNNAGGGEKGGKYQFTAQLNRRTIFDEIIDEARLRETTSGKNPFALA